MVVTSVDRSHLDLGPAPRYDIEADWTLMTTCNFRCAYCFHPPARLGAKIRPPASPEKLARFFDRSGLTWHLHLTGGEPFHYPDFLELTARLTRRHVISINSNLDSPRVKAFAARIDPDRVLFINGGIHFAQRLARNRLEAFVEHVMALRLAGFDTFVTSVMAPHVFPEFPQRWQELADRGIAVWPKVMRGVEEGRRYPAAYSEEQRALIDHYSRLAEAMDRDRIALRLERPTIDPTLDRERFLGAPIAYRQRQCLAGSRFVTIDPRGRIHRCGQRDPLGSIVHGTFRRLEGPHPCGTSFCPYYCEKYSLPDPGTGTAESLVLTPVS